MDYQPAANLQKSPSFLREFVFPPRFSGLHIIVAVIGGAVFGIKVGIKLAQRNAPVPAEVDSVTMTLPVPMGTDYLAFSNALTPGGTNQKIDGSPRTNVQKLETRKSDAK